MSGVPRPGEKEGTGAPYSREVGRENALSACLGHETTGRRASQPDVPQGTIVCGQDRGMVFP